jgi:hypothetical protein
MKVRLAMLPGAATSPAAARHSLVQLVAGSLAGAVGGGVEEEAVEGAPVAERGALQTTCEKRYDRIQSSVVLDDAEAAADCCCCCFRESSDTSRAVSRVTEAGSLSCEPNAVGLTTTISCDEQ